MAPYNGPGQGNDPHAEDDLHFAEGVEEPGAEGNVILGVVLRFIDGSSFVFFDFPEVAGFMKMSHLLEDSGKESVENGAGKDDGGNQVEVMLRHGPFLDLFPEASAFPFVGFVPGILVGRERKREMGMLLFPEVPFASFRVSRFSTSRSRGIAGYAGKGEEEQNQEA